VFLVGLRPTKSNVDNFDHNYDFNGKVIVYSIEPVCIEKNSKKREFSSLRASRGVTTAPIVLVREYIFFNFLRSFHDVGLFSVGVRSPKLSLGSRIQ